MIIWFFHNQTIPLLQTAGSPLMASVIWLTTARRALKLSFSTLLLLFIGCTLLFMVVPPNVFPCTPKEIDFNNYLLIKLPIIPLLILSYAFIWILTRVHSVLRLDSNVVWSSSSSSMSFSSNSSLFSSFAQHSIWVETLKFFPGNSIFPNPWTAAMPTIPIAPTNAAPPTNNVAWNEFCSASLYIPTFIIFHCYISKTVYITEYTALPWQCLRSPWQLHRIAWLLEHNMGWHLCLLYQNNHSRIDQQHHCFVYRRCRDRNLRLK